MTQPWDKFDPTWLIGLAKTQVPKWTWLVRSLRNCNQWQRESEGYFFFLDPTEPNLPPLTRCVRLRSLEEGRVILDVLEDSRILGIQFIDRKGSHVGRGQRKPRLEDALSGRAPTIRRSRPKGSEEFEANIGDSDGRNRSVSCGACGEELMLLESNPGPISVVTKWVECPACHAWSSFPQPDYKQPIGKYTRSRPGDWARASNKPKA